MELTNYFLHFILLLLNVGIYIKCIYFSLTLSNSDNWENFPFPDPYQLHLILIAFALFFSTCVLFWLCIFYASLSLKLH